MGKDLCLAEEGFRAGIESFIKATYGKKRLIGIWLCERIGDKLYEISTDRLEERLQWIEAQIEAGNAEGLVLAHVDGAHMWMRKECDMPDFDRRYKKFLEMTEGKKRQLGIYFINYGEGGGKT